MFSTNNDGPTMTMTAPGTRDDDVTDGDCDVTDGDCDCESPILPSSSSYHVRLPDDSIQSSTSVDAIRTLLEQDGFVVLSRLIPSDILQEWHSFSQEYFQWSLKILHERGHITNPSYERIQEHNNDDDQKSTGNENQSDYTLGLGIKHGFREIVMRSPGRFELSLLNVFDDSFHPCHRHQSSTGRIDFPSIPDLQIITSILEPLIPFLMNKTSLQDLKLCHVSLLIAVPGSTDQAWHADGGHVSLTEHLPCHCLNIFIPLQNITHTMGPTEFRPGGHVFTRRLAAMVLAAKCRKTTWRPPVWPALMEEDIVLFDYRILHRGRANMTQRTDRHVLVLTYCEPWFEDILNFPKRSMFDPVEVMGAG